jgi:hypothetical protein
MRLKREALESFLRGFKGLIGTRLKGFYLRPLRGDSRRSENLNRIR